MLTPEEDDGVQTERDEDEDSISTDDEWMVDLDPADGRST